MTYFLLQMAAVAVVSALVAVLRGRRSRRRRAGLRSGNEVACRARLSVGTGPLAVGRLTLSPGQVTWQGRRSDRRIDLVGAQVLASTAASGSGMQAEEELVLLLGLPDGTTAQLQLYRDDAATVQRHLQGLAHLDVRSAPAPPPSRASRRPWWAIACVAVAMLWVLGWGFLVIGGHSVNATVTGGDGDGLCQVRWTDEDSSRHTGEVDCSDEPAGSRRTVWALGWPATDEPMDPAWTTGSVLLFGALVAAPGAARLVRLRVRRRSDVPPQAAPPTLRYHQDLPELEAEDLRPFAGEQPAALTGRLAPYARRQVPDDGWEDPRRPDGVRGPLRPARIALTLRGPAIALVVVLCAGCWWAYRWAVLETRPTDTATAVSTGEVSVEGPGPYPDDVTVQFRGLSGSAQQADVATSRELPEGAQVRVEYSIEHPGEARLVGEGDALDRGAAITGVGLLLVAGWTGWRVRAIARHVSGVHRAYREPPRPVLGLLTADGDGAPLVLLCDPLVTPVQFLAVPVEAPLPAGTAAAFGTDRQVLVHGRLTAGEFVTVEAPSVPARLFPAGPVVHPDRDVLVAVLDSAGALARSDEDDDELPTDDDVD